MFLVRDHFQTCCKYDCLFSVFFETAQIKVLGRVYSTYMCIHVITPKDAGEHKCLVHSNSSLLCVTTRTHTHSHTNRQTHYHSTPAAHAHTGWLCKTIQYYIVYTYWATEGINSAIHKLSHWPPLQQQDAPRGFIPGVLLAYYVPRNFLLNILTGEWSG